MPSHPFFQKLTELRNRFPYLPYNFRTYKGFENTNTPYCDEMTMCSDSHLSFTCAELSRSAYCTYLLKGNECLDCDSGSEMQLCVECTGYSEKCYACTYCNTCKNCFNCHFCDTCFNCADCFGCVELENKKYHIYNKAYTEGEYKRKLDELRQKNPAEVLAKVDELRKKIPMVNLVEFENTDSDLLAFSFFNTRCIDLSYSRENEDCTHLFESVKCKSTTDGNLIFQTQMCAEISNSDTVTHSAFLIDCARVHFSYFSNYCNDCSHCFGCVGLEFKEYHILNKPYTEQEYHYHVDKILKEFAEQGIPFGAEWYRIWSLDAGK